MKNTYHKKKMAAVFNNKTVVITGGTGSLGKVLVRRILTGLYGTPKKLIIFSRDEAKQFYMREEILQNKEATEDIIYGELSRGVEFRIGDIRDYHSVSQVLKDANIVINAAALKQVPSCEYVPYEAVQTNIIGAENIVRAIEENNLSVETVLGISTDKACKPINVMGMTKAIQERVFVMGNIRVPKTRFICVRYGNVLASRGSVIPFFHEQLKKGGPLTVTHKEMTRFLLSLETAVDTIIAALNSALPGETYIPIVPSVLILNVAKAIAGKKTKIEVTRIRPGEKLHESLVSPEEGWRTFQRGGYYTIRPMLPEISSHYLEKKPLDKEYSSADSVMTLAQTQELLKKHGLLVGGNIQFEGEFLK